MAKTDDDNQVRQIAVGAAILGVLALMICGALIGWGYLPGLFGEWVGTMVGVVTTPFFLEAFFVLLGVTLVIAINVWRRRREGDECIYLEQVDGAGDLPEHAKWAKYREKPLPGEVPSLLAQAEGALAIGDLEAAGEALGAMDEEELKRPEVLVVRLGLARAAGKAELADRLEIELRAARGGAC